MVKWTTDGVSAATSDTDPSFAATFDGGRYLFNLPENATRTIIQTARGFTKSRAVFLTRTSTVTSAGLPGTPIATRTR